MNSSKAIVYSCSGCSNVAQLANAVALQLDRLGVAEMSCIAGVGGDVPALVKLATSGRPIIAIDGCPLHCVKNCLQRHQVTPDLHLTLNQQGIRKKNGVLCEASRVDEVAANIQRQWRQQQIAAAEIP